MSKDKHMDKSRDKHKELKKKSKDDHSKYKEKKKDKSKEKKKDSIKDKNKEKVLGDQHKDKSKKTKDEKQKRKKMKKAVRTRAAKAGLFFPVGRIHRLLKEEVPRKTRVGATAAIYIAAVMEYVIAEVLELAGKDAISKKKTRITPRNLCLAIKNDQELSHLIRATISEGGVVPNEFVQKNAQQTQQRRRDN